MKTPNVVKVGWRIHMGDGHGPLCHGDDADEEPQTIDPELVTCSECRRRHATTKAAVRAWNADAERLRLENNG